jgi:putative DNA primase/helicase
VREIENVFQKLEGVERRNGYWIALCPAHNDHDPSLSIKIGDGGKLLLYCHAGCSFEQIMAALLAEPPASSQIPSRRGEPTNVWQVRDVSGELKGLHLRFDRPNGDKKCLWKRPSGEWGLNGTPLSAMPLYRSEHVKEWPEDLPVVVVEGEKAADALAAVYPATLGTVTGASNTPGREALEVLRGRPVILWADNDDEGRAHMRRIAEALQRVVAEVKIFEWSDGPPKGDAADHPAVLNRSKNEFRELLDAMATAPIYSSAPRDGVADERILRFKTAKELAEETPAVTEWVARPWVAKGAITEVDGKIKAGGKTTWVTYMARKILDGEPFMGEPTTRTKAIFLTEQPPASFRKALERAELLEREDLLILHWHDTRGVTWSDVARATVEKATEVGAGILFVDTLGQFAGIRGDGENNAGAAQEAMRPLQEAAARGLAVVLTRHERKGGGEVGESGRGSSAFGGAVDVILSIRRGEGNTRPSVRIIESLSRFDETPGKLVIELTEDGYKSLGDATAFAETEAINVILELLPSKEENAMPTDDVLDKLKEQDIKRTVATDALANLATSGMVRRIGAGKKGSPYRYYMPTPDEDEMDSSATPEVPDK